MNAVNRKSLVSDYQTGDADLFALYVVANGISNAQQSMRKAEIEDIIALTALLENNGHLSIY